MDKRKLSRRAEPTGGAGNSSGVSLETLHQLAASYFIDRESTLRRLHHIQIATAAIKVGEGGGSRGGQQPLGASRDPRAASRPGEGMVERAKFAVRLIYGKLGALTKARFSAGCRQGCRLSASQLAGN